MEREEKEAEEQQNLESENSIDLKRVLELKEKLKAIRAAQQGVEIEGEDEGAINAEIKSLEKKMDQQTERLQLLEKHKKWNWVCVSTDTAIAQAVLLLLCIGILKLTVPFFLLSLHLRKTCVM